jgi:aldoxime dehydratase
MESAIPPHLRCPRSREARASQDYSPPYSAWVARMEPKITQVVMGYFGVQLKGKTHAAPAADAMKYLLEHFAIESGPGHHDMARCTDERGFDTLIAIADWDDPAVFQRWIASPSLAQWWADPQRGKEGIGLLADGLSGEIQEHGYWGAARDRLPISQTDGLRATSAVSATAPAPGQRVVVRPNDNLALIRSGQEWTQTSGSSCACTTMSASSRPTSNRSSTLTATPGRCCCARWAAGGESY